MPAAGYDVIVAGGGAGGIGAAVGAAQAGARVALLERAPFLGGAATLSSVLTYCGFWTQANPPQQCVGGVGAAVLREIERYDGLDGPVRMGASNVVVALLDPEAVKIACDRVCAHAGVDVVLHAFLTAAHAEGDHVARATYSEHGGSRRLEAAAFVDATGEADLAALAGAAVRYGDRQGRVQNGTLVMRFGGIERDADVSRGVWARAVRDGKAHGLSEMTKEYGFVSRLPVSGDVVAFLADEAYDARDARSTSAAERRGRRQAWAYLEAIRALPGHGRAYLVSTGPAIGTRESRHVQAVYCLRQADVESAAGAEDGVALGGWPIEFHGAPGEPNVWRRIRGEGAYAIPLRTLRSVSHRNLFAAGRTIDAEPYAFASARVMGTAFATGHAAGVAAALTAASGSPPDSARVRAELLRQDAILALPDERTAIA